MTAREKAKDFLSKAHLFKLGVLDTEKPHPKTHNLSELAAHDLQSAITHLQEIDLDALRALQTYWPQLQILKAAIDDTLKNNGRIFLCGCGATGRLSLSLEYLWRALHHNDDRVVSFMAGGDIALVHAIEGFEDFPEYGARQLLQLGFGENDLLISSTEGGETPFVIGATEKAAEIAKREPFFLYCNPRNVLVENVERSRRVLENKNIHSISLATGPMALAGSTRMQASTVLQLAIGLCLFFDERTGFNALTELIKTYQETSLTFLQEFIKKESDLYQSGHHVVYLVHDFAITIFTDTTERAPTFSLVPFNNEKLARPTHSLCYVSLPETANPLQAWQTLLHRQPRNLNWSQVNVKTCDDYLLNYDFSEHAISYRRRVLPQGEHYFFDIDKTAGGLKLVLGRDHALEIEAHLSIGHLPLLSQHIFLKMLLNIHSTLVMGRLGRYQHNIMTWVFPTNGKLIDRATRYITHLLQADHNIKAEYAAVVSELFEQLETLKENESVVLKTCKAFLRRK